MQAKRIQVNESNLSVAGQVDVDLIAPLTPREEINFHNIWGGVSVEPQNADANAQGTWVLYILRESTNGFVWTDGVVNGEENNAIVIACGIWSASNESPFNMEPLHPSTSRTLQAGDRLRLSCVVTGITAGSASCRVMLCAHVTRK